MLTQSRTFVFIVLALAACSVEQRFSNLPNPLTNNDGGSSATSDSSTSGASTSGSSTSGTSGSSSTSTGSSTSGGGNETSQISIPIGPVCSNWYAGPTRVGTTLHASSGVIPHLYHLTVNATAPLYSAVGNEVTLPAQSLSPGARRTSLLASNPLELVIGTGLPNGNYLVTLCAADSQFQAACAYQPGDTVISHLGASPSPGTGLLLVGAATSEPLVLQAQDGVLTVRHFSTPAKTFYPMPILVTGDACTF